LIVVEAALAGLVVALAPRTIGAAAFTTSRRATDIAARSATATAVESAARRSA
jgi:hypothetical protein